MKIKQAKSYGIIPIFKKDEVFYTVCVKNHKSGQWGLPKGTPENKETPIETAIRELKEETGVVDISLVDSVTFKESYSFEQDDIEYHKTNTYFIGFVTEMIVGDVLDEIDDIRWIEIDKIEKVISFENLLNLVKDVKSYLNKNEVSEQLSTDNEGS